MWTGDDCFVGDTISSGNADILGRPENIAVERGLGEFRCGRPVIMAGAGDRVVLPVDGLTNDRLASFRRLCAPAKPHLVLTARRALALGIHADGPVGLAISDREDAAAILSLAADARVERRLSVVAAGPVAEAAIELAKLAQLLPALLVADAVPATAACEPPLMRVSSAAVAQFRQAAIESLAVAAEANIPLNGGVPARFVIFRDAIGGTSVAVIVGRPD